MQLTLFHLHRALRNPPSQAKRALEVEVAEIQCLPVQLSSSQGEQLVQLVQDMAEWDRLEESSRGQVTQDLLECLGVGDEAEDAYQLSMTAWSLVMLKHHLPPPAATSAFSAFIRHCTSSEAMKTGSWRDWSQLLHALEAAGMQCSKCPELARLCNRAVQLLPGKLVQSLSDKDISMPLSAMVALRYRGSAQPLLQAITAAISQGLIMETAGSKNYYWSELIVAAGGLAGCGREIGQLLKQFAAKATASIDGVDAEHALSTLLRTVRPLLWPKTGFVKKRAAGHPRGEMDSSQLAFSLYCLAFLGYLDSSVRSLAANVAEADLTAFGAHELIMLLDARSKFLALSIQQAVSSGHSQLASEPQLNSMAAALWRECSRREADGLKWSLNDQKQLHIFRQLKDACTGGQTSLTASPPSPSLQKFVAKKISGKVLWDIEGIDVEAEAWRRQLASDNERAAFTWDQVRASLPEAEAWQQVLQAASAGTCNGEPQQVDQLLSCEVDAGMLQQEEAEEMPSQTSGPPAQDLTAFGARDLTALLYARSMFLSLSIRQAVSSGHSQLASEPQLDSMAAALWREYSRREAVGQQWSKQDLQQLDTASQTKDACIGGQTPSAALPLPTTWLPSGSSSKLSEPGQALRTSEPPPQAKLDLEELKAVVEKLPVQMSSSQGKQLVQLVQEMAHWDRLGDSSRDKLTQDLLQCLGVGGEAEDAYQLSMAALSLVKLKRHLPPPAATSAFSAFISHCASSETMKRGNWSGWSKLLHALGAAGLQCSTCPDLTRLCDQAVQLLPGKLAFGPADKNIRMLLKAMVSVGYRGSAQPLLQAVTTACSQGLLMVDAGFEAWGSLIRAARGLTGGCMETSQLLECFAAKVSGSMDNTDAQDVSALLNAMSLAWWPDRDFCRQLAERAAGGPSVGMSIKQLAINLCKLACLGYLDSSVRSLAIKVAETKLTAFKPQQLTNLLHARSMFLRYYDSCWMSLQPRRADVSIILSAMRLVMWPDTNFVKQLAVRAAGGPRFIMGSSQLAITLHNLAYLGYLDSSVRDLAAKVVEADLTSFGAHDLTKLFHARSMFLALSIHHAVSLGHSQLASEPQLDSMAAALWRECSRRGPDHAQWRANHLNQLYAASQWLHACTGGQTSLTESPALLELVAKAITCQTSSIESAHTEDGCVDHNQLVQALAAAGYNEVEQGAVSLDGTYCAQLVVKGPGLTRGIAGIVYHSQELLPDGGMSGVVAHAKLQQLAHFDAGVVINKAVFDQLASDSERAAFMGEQVQASLPEAKAWRKVLQAASVGSGDNKPAA
ncbi:hypothetical protein QJQ45_013425 [Haematococcus lacustris]|nr:hypothetical protein QJQ45_013425 [Haematococcus lacustris]